MNIDRLDLNLLRVFNALMLELSVSKAAERIHISQSAMSNALNRLRQTLDDPLLVRVGQGMKPTSKALQMEQPVRAALQLIENSLAPETEFNPATSERVFRILATDYVQLLILSDLMAHFQQLAPNVRIDIAELGSDVPEQALEQGDFDFAIGRFPALSKRLSSHCLFYDELVCLVSRESQRFGDRISEEDFLRYPQVWGAGAQKRGMTDEWLAANNKQRRIAISTPSFLMAPVYVAKTDMLSVAPRKVAEQYQSYLPLKILPLPIELPPFDVTLIWHPCHGETHAHRWFREQLIALCQSLISSDQAT